MHTKHTSKNSFKKATVLVRFRGNVSLVRQFDKMLPFNMLPTHESSGGLRTEACVSTQ